MRAVILAGGKGRRLYPYTAVLPKPLVPIGDISILEVVIRQLAHYGFTHITMAVGHHAELIMAVMGDGHKWNVRIDYSVEDKPLNTIGPLQYIENLDKPFLVMNGDLLTDLDYRALYARHCQSDGIATVATCKKHVKISLGVLEYDEHNHLTRFEEKPEMDFNVSMGVYVFEPRVLSHIPAGEAFGFDHLMQRLLDKNETVFLHPFEGHWLDMGTHEDLERAMLEFEQHRLRYLPS